MRQLTSSRGFTLIELMVTLAVLAIIALAGVPALSDYVANTKLREGSNSLSATVQLARAEALQRNVQVTVTVNGQLATMSTGTGASLVTLRTVNLPAGFQTSAFTATFDSAGLLTPFGTPVVVTTSLSNKTCSGDIRCPAVRIEAGGAVGICATGTCS